MLADRARAGILAEMNVGGEVSRAIAMLNVYSYARFTLRPLMLR
jgi:hypothetical protein